MNKFFSKNLIAVRTRDLLSGHVYACSDLRRKLRTMLVEAKGVPRDIEQSSTYSERKDRY
jgi:hypothetical protein